MGYQVSGDYCCRLFAGFAKRAKIGGLRGMRVARDMLGRKGKGMLDMGGGGHASGAVICPEEHMAILGTCLRTKYVINIYVNINEITKKKTAGVWR